MAVGRPGLQYLKQVARNTAVDSSTAMKRMACNSSRWKAANQSKDWGIRRSYTLRMYDVLAIFWALSRDCEERLLDLMFV